MRDFPFVKSWISKGVRTTDCGKKGREGRWLVRLQGSEERLARDPQGFRLNSSE